MPNLEWDLRFLELATLVASWSKDPSTQCGAVITFGNQTVSSGFNGFPRGCDDNSALYSNRDLKYDRVIHAEINAILFAKQDLTDATIYTVPFPPCARCMAVIIQAGIGRVVAFRATDQALEDRWSMSNMRAMEMATEAGVVYEVYDKSTMVKPEDCPKDLAYNLNTDRLKYKCKFYDAVLVYQGGLHNIYCDGTMHLKTGGGKLHKADYIVDYIFTCDCAKWKTSEEPV